MSVVPSCLLRATHSFAFAYADGALHEWEHYAYMSCGLQHCCELHQITVDGTGKMTKGDTAATVMADIAETNSPLSFPTAQHSRA